MTSMEQLEVFGDAFSVNFSCGLLLVYGLASPSLHERRSRSSQAPAHRALAIAQMENVPHRLHRVSYDHLVCALDAGYCRGIPSRQRIVINVNNSSNWWLPFHK